MGDELTEEESMYGDYPATETKSCIDVPRLTLSERLQQERNNLMQRVSEIDQVLAALEATPQVKMVLDLLQKTRCL